VSRDPLKPPFWKSGSFFLLCLLLGFGIPIAAFYHGVQKEEYERSDHVIYAEVTKIGSYTSYMRNGPLLSVKLQDGSERILKAENLHGCDIGSPIALRSVAGSLKIAKAACHLGADGKIRS
jgi:hypothetical protein